MLKVIIKEESVPAKNDNILCSIKLQKGNET